MASIDWNRRTWDDPKNWSELGDSWTFHAQAFDKPYEDWKQSVVATFLIPFLGPEKDVVEIAPGYGRWTEYMVGKVRSLKLVDLSPSCIDKCKERFSGHPEIEFLVNDGRSLPFADDSADVVWSFSSFVHIDESEIDAYLSEMFRVLRPGGRFVVHHSGWADWTLRFANTAGRLGKPGRALLHRVAQGRWRGAGERSPMSAERFDTLARSSGLIVDDQIRRWGDGEFGLALGDVVTVGSRPALGQTMTLPKEDAGSAPKNLEQRKHRQPSRLRQSRAGATRRGRKSGPSSTN